MAAFHSVRSLTEAMLAGASPVQALAQQFNHLSYAASGPGGVTAAFGAIAKMVGPSGFLLGGIAGAGLFANALANVSDQVTRNKNDFNALRARFLRRSERRSRQPARLLLAPLRKFAAIVCRLLGLYRMHLVSRTSTGSRRSLRRHPFRYSNLLMLSNG